MRGTVNSTTMIPDNTLNFTLSADIAVDTQNYIDIDPNSTKSDNDTYYYYIEYDLSNSTDELKFYPGLIAFDITVLTFTMITIIIGVASWVLIRNFRHIRNYVYLNLILSNAMCLILKLIDFLPPHLYNIDFIFIVIINCCYLYFKLANYFWLFILCYIFYIDIVKVLNIHMAGRYLKANLFGWGLPMLLTVWCLFIMPLLMVDAVKTSSYILLGSMFSLLAINLFIYILVLYALLRGPGSGMPARSRHVPLATFIFLLSGVIMLILPLRLIYKFPEYLPNILLNIPTTALNVYFMILKSNRTLWYDYYIRIRGNNQ